MSEQAFESNNHEDVGATSSESATDKNGLLDSFNVYNAMMLVSMACVLMAIFLLFAELNTFGNILSGEFPWRTEISSPPVLPK
ncbi:MAG: hypothetical protein MK106_12825 [Mariniblastus sp.]|nr:hypothetical protein [Mariniblastus sp.]